MRDQVVDDCQHPPPFAPSSESPRNRPEHVAEQRYPETIDHQVVFPSPDLTGYTPPAERIHRVKEPLGTDILEPSPPAPPEMHRGRGTQDTGG